MKILDALLKRGSSADAAGTDASSSDAGEVPFPGYDRLGHRAIGLKLPELSQVELAAVETYERAHQALVGADSEKVKAIRHYETKFAHRQQVLDEEKAERVRASTR
jgi:hypothetical protein